VPVLVLVLTTGRFTVALSNLLDILLAILLVAILDKSSKTLGSSTIIVAGAPNALEVRGVGVSSSTGSSNVMPPILRCLMSTAQQCRPVAAQYYSVSNKSSEKYWIMDTGYA
jgi:hypothetical protein